MRNKNANRPPTRNIAITAGAPKSAATVCERMPQSDKVNVETTLGALTPTVSKIQTNGRNTARNTKYSPLAEILTVSIWFTSPMESFSRRRFHPVLYTLTRMRTPSFLRKEAGFPGRRYTRQCSQHPQPTYKEGPFDSS